MMIPTLANPALDFEKCWANKHFTAFNDRYWKRHPFFPAAGIALHFREATGGRTRARCLRHIASGWRLLRRRERPGDTADGDLALDRRVGGEGTIERQHGRAGIPAPRHSPGRHLGRRIVARLPVILTGRGNTVALGFEKTGRIDGVEKHAA